MNSGSVKVTCVGALGGRFRRMVAIGNAMLDSSDIGGNNGFHTISKRFVEMCREKLNEA